MNIKDEIRNIAKITSMIKKRNLDNICMNGKVNRVNTANSVFGMHSDWKNMEIILEANLGIEICKNVTSARNAIFLERIIK